MTNPTGRVTRVPLDALTPHPRNVREGDVGAIVESLRAFGQYRPIVVQWTAADHSAATILAGTHTWRAHVALAEHDPDRWGWIDVVGLDVDDDTALRIMLADNRTHDLGRDRPDALAELLASLDGPTLVGTGWTGDDLDDILRDLGTYDPGAGILSAFDGVEGRDESAKTFLHGRDADGNDLYVLRLSLTESQRDDVMRAFKRAKANGTPTQPEAIALISRAYVEAHR